MRLAIIISLLVGLSVASPPTPSICGRRNPKIEECMKKSIAELTPHLREGIPEWNVPRLEPLYIEEMMVAIDDTVKAKATELYLRGMTYFNITYLKVDLKNKKITLSVIFPKAEVDARVDLNVKLLVPIVGQGTMHSNLEQIKADVELVYDSVRRKDKTYMYFKEITLNLDIGRNEPHFKLANDPGGILGNAVNSVLLTDDGRINADMLPIFQREISNKIIELANKVCENFPEDELMPDRE